jgi:23S rRNA (guanosine2251-2'-O)-methyltransferase
MSEILSGRHAVEEALAGSAREVEEILVPRGAREEPGSSVAALARQRGIRTSVLDRESFESLAARGTSVAARCSAFRYRAEQDLPRGQGNELVIVLDGIQDPQNLGAIIRTAEVAGAAAVCIAARRAAQVTPAVVRASAGATEHLPIYRVVNIARVLRRLRKTGYWSVGLAPEGGEAWDQVDYRGPIALVVGAEGDGLRRLVAHECDHLVALPVHGRVQSLNASAAFAAVAFEVLRQRGS